MNQARLKDLPFDSAPYRGLEHNPSVTVRSDVVYGGPSNEPTGDTRLFLEERELVRLLEIARQSPTLRVVIHHAGLRIRRIQDGSAVVNVVSIVGDKPEPEPFTLAGVR